jgi:hypothetical protein
MKMKVMFPLPNHLPQDDDTSPPSDPNEVEPLISLHALTGISSPQTLKLIGYIKHQKVIILIDSGNTHNLFIIKFLKRPIAYIHAVNKFQIMIANGGSMKCGGHCENVHCKLVIII